VVAAIAGQADRQDGIAAAKLDQRQAVENQDALAVGPGAQLGGRIRYELRARRSLAVRRRRVGRRSVAAAGRIAARLGPLVLRKDFNRV